MLMFFAADLQESSRIKKEQAILIRQNPRNSAVN